MYSLHVSKRSSVPHVNKFLEIASHAFSQILISQALGNLELETLRMTSTLLATLAPKHLVKSLTLKLPPGWEDAPIAPGNSALTATHALRMIA